MKIGAPIIKRRKRDQWSIQHAMGGENTVRINQPAFPMTRLKKLGFGDSAMKRITNARVAYDLSRAKYAQKTGKLM